jgi:hypothetical protein
MSDARIQHLSALIGDICRMAYPGRVAHQPSTALDPTTLRIMTPADCNTQLRALAGPLMEEAGVAAMESADECVWSTPGALLQRNARAGAASRIAGLNIRQSTQAAGCVARASK